MPNLASLPVADLQAGTANWSGQGYIDGLKMQWVSATAITVTSGAAFVPSLNKCLQAPNAIAVTGLVLAASTWYHVYLYLNGSTPAIEVVTTAPSAPYSGTACTKTADTSRRYVGSVLTDASGNIWYFKHAVNRITLGWGGAGLAPQRPLSFGSAVVATTINFAAAVPQTATHATCRFQNVDSSVGARIANSQIPGAVGSSGTGTNFLFAIAPNSINVLDGALDSNQALIYWMISTPTSGISIDIFGYIYER